MEHCTTQLLGACDEAAAPSNNPLRDLKKDKEALDALSLTGQQAQTGTMSMEVSSPLKLMADPIETNERNKGTEGPEVERKVKTTA